MGLYYHDLFGMIVNSKRKLVTITVETQPQIPAVCFEIHELIDNKFVAFWNYEMLREEQLHFMRSYKCSHPKLKLTLKEIRDSEGYRNALKDSIPVHQRMLFENEMDIIQKMLDIRFPEPYYYEGGPDGHAYNIIFADNPEQLYHCWENVPKEWMHFADVMELLLDLAEELQEYRKEYAPIPDKTIWIMN